MLPRHFYIILFIFTPLYLAGGTSRAAQFTPPAMTNNMAVDNLITRQLAGAVEEGGHQNGMLLIAERLDFLSENFRNLGSNPALKAHLGVDDGANECEVKAPPVEQLAARHGDEYVRWRRAHLLAEKYHQKFRGSDQAFELTATWKNYEERLMLSVQHRHARQEVYDQRITAALRERTYGIRNQADAICKVNESVLPALLREQAEEIFEDYGSRDIRLGQQINPSVGGVAIGLLDRALFTPWRNFYRRHKSKIDALSQLLIILSASAFIFNKLGGTEWVKNNIRRMFDRPTVYEVLRRKKGWLDHAKPGEVVREDDLILAPTLRKQVSELIYLLRRRYELRKKTGRRYAMTPVLLYGPPGTGKTTIARMIADQSLGDNGGPMNFIKMVASEFMQVKNEGDRVAVLKRMFAEARRMGNTVIFLDEIDGMVRQRGQGDEKTNRAFLDQLLDLIERPDPDVLVIAATNHEQRMDDALRNRFRRKFAVPLPTAKQRDVMIARHARRTLIAQGYKVTFNSGEIANIMQGAAGRDIETFMMRIRDRLAFEGKNEASVDVAFQVMREMGFLPALDEDDEVIMPIDTEELIST